MTAFSERLLRGEVKFGESLKTRIEARGISPRQVALRAGITPAFLSKILSGKVGYSPETIERIADALAPDGADEASRADLRSELLQAAFVGDAEVLAAMEYIPNSLNITVEGYDDLSEPERHATEEAAAAAGAAMARAFREARRRAGTIGFGADRYEGEEPQ
jgi:transcriptional regulator with XRE-family HTH domain